MMTTEDRQEQLSVSYLKAICAYKGIIMQVNQYDDDSYDVAIRDTIQLDNGGEFISLINIQLKSTCRELRDDGDCLYYSLKIKNFRDLRMEATAPRLLMLLLLPREEANWLSQNIDELVIRQCMYWVDLSNEPDSDNEYNITIRIPKNNRVTCDSLTELLERFARRTAR